MIYIQYRTIARCNDCLLRLLDIDKWSLADRTSVDTSRHDILKAQLSQIQIVIPPMAQLAFKAFVALEVKVAAKDTSFNT